MEGRIIYFAWSISFAMWISNWRREWIECQKKRDGRD
jgi:hypothetical protein